MTPIAKGHLRVVQTEAADPAPAHESQILPFPAMEAAEPVYVPPTSQEQLERQKAMLAEGAFKSDLERNGDVFFSALELRKSHNKATTDVSAAPDQGAQAAAPKDFAGRKTFKRDPNAPAMPSKPSV